MASNQTTLPNVSENEETLLTGVNENVYEDQSIGAELTKKDINRVALPIFRVARIPSITTDEGSEPAEMFT